MKLEFPSVPFPFELIREELSEIEREVGQQVGRFDPAVAGYVEYICNTAGKRIRPALAILAGGATGEVSSAHIKLGVIVELIHIASLVHDDIMDQALIRRKMATANARWGNALSVLLGDCLFSHALVLATEFQDNKVSNKIALATKEVCSGEIMQTQRRFDFKLTREDYFRIIEMKTAALFAITVELAALLNGATETVQERMHDFGLKIGTAYQIYDDCIDLVGKESTYGKTLRTDLAKGKLTLPILNLIESANTLQKAKLNKLLLQKEPIEVNVLAGIADYEGAIESAIQTARDLLDSARQDLLMLNGNTHCEALKQVTFYLNSLLNQCSEP